MSSPPTKRSKPPGRRPGLTALQLRFVDEYLIDLSAAHAYARAGGTGKAAGARVIACRWLADPRIAALVAERQAARAARVALEADRVLVELGRIAFADLRRLFNAKGELLPPSQWPDDVAPAIASMDLVMKGARGGGVEYVRKLRLWDKTAALTAAMKHLGLLVERVELPQDATFTLRLDDGASIEAHEK